MYILYILRIDFIYLDDKIDDKKVNLRIVIEIFGYLQ